MRQVLQCISCSPFWWQRPNTTCLNVKDTCTTMQDSHAQPCRTQTLASFLDEYKHFPGLGVHWVMFGPGGHTTRPEGGGVLRHYSRCEQKPHGHIKMIVNTFYVARNAEEHPHNFEFRCARGRYIYTRCCAPYGRGVVVE